MNNNFLTGSGIYSANMPALDACFTTSRNTFLVTPIHYYTPNTTAGLPDVCNNANVLYILDNDGNRLATKLIDNGQVSDLPLDFYFDEGVCIGTSFELGNVLQAGESCKRIVLPIHFTPITKGITDQYENGFLMVTFDIDDTISLIQLLRLGVLEPIPDGFTFLDGVWINPLTGGPQGISITASRINSNGELELDYLNPNPSAGALSTWTENLGSVVGSKGTTGDGFTNATIDSSGNLWITPIVGGVLQSPLMIGSVAGPQGIQGNPGYSILAIGMTSPGGNLLITTNNPNIGTNGVWLSPGSIIGPQGLQGVGFTNVTVDSNGYLTFTRDSGQSSITLANSIMGPAGPTGPAPGLAVRSVASGASPDVQIVQDSGNPDNYFLDFTLQQGPQGVAGTNGDSITSVLIDSNGHLIVHSTNPNVGGDLGLVVGANGAQGPQGATGATGRGISQITIAGNDLEVWYTDSTSWTNLGLIVPTVNSLTVTTTLPAGSSATASVVMDSTKLMTFSFGIPTGATGAAGRGISSAIVDNTGFLNLTYTDGTSSGGLGPVKGDDGAPGVTPTITALATTVGYNQNADVSVGGTTEAPVLTFSIPRGVPGPEGPAGTGILFMGTVDTHADLPSSGMVQGDAYYNLADDLLYIYNGTEFPADGAGVPFRGPQGLQGDVGATGNGIATMSITNGNLVVTYTNNPSPVNLGKVIPTINSLPSVTTGLPGSSASASISTDPSTGVVNFSFTIPQGPKGDKGDPGTNGTNGTNGVDGVNGLNGINGVSISNVVMTSGGQLLVYLADGTIFGPFNVLGPTGNSAYQEWLDQGNTGTEEDFFDYLANLVAPKSTTVYLEDPSFEALDDTIAMTLTDANVQFVAAIRDLLLNSGGLIIEDVTDMMNFPFILNGGLDGCAFRYHRDPDNGRKDLTRVYVYNWAGTPFSFSPASNFGPYYSTTRPVLTINGTQNITVQAETSSAQGVINVPNGVTVLELEYLTGPNDNPTANSFFVTNLGVAFLFSLSNTPLSSFCTSGSNSTSLSINNMNVRKDTIRSITFGADYSGVTSIPNNFLRNCDGLTSVNLSGLTGVTTIGDYFLSNVCPAGSNFLTLNLSMFNNLSAVGNNFADNNFNFRSIIIGNKDWNGVNPASGGTGLLQGLWSVPTNGTIYAATNLLGVNFRARFNVANLNNWAISVGTPSSLF